MGDGHEEVSGDLCRAETPSPAGWPRRARALAPVGAPRAGRSGALEPAPRTSRGRRPPSRAPGRRMMAAGGGEEPHWFMDKQEVTDRVIHVLKHFDGINESKISPTAGLEKDLGLDSLDRVEFVFALEQEFNLTIADEAAEKLYEVRPLPGARRPPPAGALPRSRPHTRLPPPAPLPLQGTVADAVEFVGKYPQAQ